MEASGWPGLVIGGGVVLVPGAAGDSVEDVGCLVLMPGDESHWSVGGDIFCLLLLLLL